MAFRSFGRSGITAVASFASFRVFARRRIIAAASTPLTRGLLASTTPFFAVGVSLWLGHSDGAVVDMVSNSECVDVNTMRMK